MQNFRPDPRAQARDAGVARLRWATRWSIVGATALAGAFAGVAAHSSPGHKSRRAPVQRATPVRHVAQAQTRTTVPAPTSDTAPAPVTTTVAPVATTGTS